MPETAKPTQLRKMPSRRILEWARADKALGPESDLEPVLGPKVMNHVGGLVKFGEIMGNVATIAVKSGLEAAQKTAMRTVNYAKRHKWGMAGIAVANGSLGLLKFIARDQADQMGVVTKGLVDNAPMWGLIATGVMGAGMLAKHLGTKPTNTSVAHSICEGVQAAHAIDLTKDPKEQRILGGELAIHKAEATRGSLVLGSKLDKQKLDAHIEKRFNSQPELQTQAKREALLAVANVMQYDVSQPKPVREAWEKGMQELQDYKKAMSEVYMSR